MMHTCNSDDRDTEDVVQAAAESGCGDLLSEERTKFEPKHTSNEGVVLCLVIESGG
jgi:hypothetical protein